MAIIAKAPCRVDLAGGTLDIWPLYLFHPGAVTVNFAVNIYASCGVRLRRDQRVVLRSLDLGREQIYKSPQALAQRRTRGLLLHTRMVRFFGPPAGIDVITDSEAPVGAGLAGSSALMVAVAGALQKLNGRRYAAEQLRTIVQDVEAQVIGVPTGCQDYYPALHGGVNAIEIGVGGARRTAIAVDPDELSERIVLAYTGAPRQSGINNWEVMKAHIDGNRRVLRNFDQIAAIARAMRRAIEKLDWPEVGRLLREEWSHRRKNAPSISTPLIDRLVEVTRRAGARGAKACGAGGGGCVVFLVARGAKPRVEAVIKAEGAHVIQARLAPRGVSVRVVPE